MKGCVVYSAHPLQYRKKCVILKQGDTRTAKEYLDFIVKQMYSTVVATVDSDGPPRTYPMTM